MVIPFYSSSVIQLAKRIFSPIQKESIIILIALSVVFVLVIDMELSNLADYFHSSISSPAGVSVFVLISGVYLTGQYFLLRYSKLALRLRAAKNDIRAVDRLVTIIEIMIILIFLLLIGEIILGSYYDLFMLILVTIVSNILTSVVMLLLFKKFIGYYKSHPHYAFLSYAISGLIIAVTAAVTIFFTVPIMLTKSAIISAASPVIFPSFVPGSILDTLNYAYYILAVSSFFSMWISTVILLAHYSKKLGKLKFWIAVTLPLAFYIGQILIISFPIPSWAVGLDQTTFILYYRILFTVSSAVGGLLFSRPFFLVSKLIPRQSNMHKNLIVLGIGVVLFFVSGSATVYHAPYPPFGLATIAIIGTSSYMMFLGLYTSVISLAEDSELYRLIRTTSKEWKFFLKLSDAEVEETIIAKVDKVKELMTTETGVSPSVSISDAKDYLNKILNETRKDHQGK